VKRIVMHCEERVTKVALLDGGKLTDYFVQATDAAQTVGNIYKGRVVNVLPGMQAAFVDIGQEKNAFLYINDLLPAHLEKQPNPKPSITELVRSGQEIVVQVAKEAVGSKGARVTTHYSIPGRWIVYMPEADYVAISRKIEADDERARLKRIAESLRRPGEGIIVRTVADGATQEAIRSDLEFLRELWDSIRGAVQSAAAPAELYRELDLIPRVIRDMFTDEVSDIVIDSERFAKEASAYLGRISPELADRVRYVPASERVFDRFNVKEQLDQLFRPKVWLDSGAYLVIERTEALTVIDVNTGKFTGSVDLEETVFAANLEAAEMIARLMRLRDMGGIIIVDFIDMDEERHREQILRRMEELVRQDRTKCVAVGWTKLGLLEMTRKKVREPIDTSAAGICPHCMGTGKVPDRG